MLSSLFTERPDVKKLPRVPDAHGDVVDGKMFSDLYIRTSWVDANVALAQIEKVSDINARTNPLRTTAFVLIIHRIVY